MQKTTDPKRIHDAPWLQVRDNEILARLLNKFGIDPVQHRDQLINRVAGAFKNVPFENLAEPTMLVDMKLACNEIENQLAAGGKRSVNCDAGYLDHNKVVLASAKEAGQKIYLDKGIYADLAGRYKAGKYQPFEWSFPDFKDGRYDKELLEIRKKYMEQVSKGKEGK